MEFLSPFRSVLTASLMVSDDRVAHLGRNPFADNNGSDDDQQNERHLGPGEHGEKEAAQRWAVSGR
jgi:hypothetical protein